MTSTATTTRTRAPLSGHLRTITSHSELMAGMEAHRKEVTSSPEAARAFLIRAGLITRSGKPKQLIRG